MQCNFKNCRLWANGKCTDTNEREKCPLIASQSELQLLHYSMRDPNRIDSFCKDLSNLWKKCPDVRFGQLIVNSLGVDPFYIEDNDALEKIRAFVSSQGKPRLDETPPLSWKDVAYWNGCVPPPEYFEPINPYQDVESRNIETGLPIINHQALSRYLKESGKKASELSREEISPFLSTDQPSYSSKDEKR